MPSEQQANLFRYCFLTPFSATWSNLLPGLGFFFKRGCLSDLTISCGRLAGYLHPPPPGAQGSEL